MRFARISFQLIAILIASMVLLTACATAATGADDQVVEESDNDESEANLPEVASETTIGTVQEIDQTKLVVNDLSIQISDLTEFSESAEVGDEVSVDYVADENGDLSAETVQVISKASAAEAEPTEEEIEY